MKKKILLAGGSGFIGQYLGKALVEKNYEVLLLSRKKAAFPLGFPAKIIHWDGEKITKDLSDVYGVVNLCGEGIANERWSHDFIKKLYDSRIKPTKAIVDALNKTNSVKVLINASAVGFYGNSLTKVDEFSPKGEGILADICEKWEDEAKRASSQIRVVIPRFATVLGLLGGALPLLLDIYASGLGVKFGKGNNFNNFIHVGDLVNFLIFALENEKVSGVYNLCAQEAITQKEFHEKLCDVTKSCKKMFVPQNILKLFLGKQAQILTEGALVQSTRVNELGYQFAYNSLDSCLQDFFKDRKYPLAHFFAKSIYLPCSVHELWEFVSDEKNLETITPPWLKFRVLGATKSPLEKDAQISYKLSLHGFPIKWQSLIDDWQKNSMFADRQIRGPYKT